MSILTHDEIQQHLQEVYDDQVRIYDASRILGSCVVGLANYNLAENMDEVRTVTVYVPTWEELCMVHPIYKEKDNNIIIDIRYYFNAIKNNSEHGLELLFSNNYVINPSYKTILSSTLIRNNEQIAHYNIHQRIETAYQDAKLAAEQKDYLTVARLWIAAQLYLDGAKLEDCFRPTKDFHKQYLLGIKHGIIEIDTDQLLDEIYMMLDRAKDTPDLAAEAQLKDGILSIMGHALHQAVDSTAFVDSLTQSECEAIHYAKESMVDGVGRWNISKLVRDTPVSRPVYNNVLRKLETSHVAKISNAGSHGMQVELYDPTIIPKVEARLAKKR